MSHSDLFHLSCACLHTHQVSPISSHYPLCIYTGCFCLSVANLSCQAYQCVFPCSCLSSPCFLVLQVQTFYACPDLEPACHKILPCRNSSLPAVLCASDYDLVCELLPVLDLPLACPLSINKPPASRVCIWVSSCVIIHCSKK